jgi:hypothetical protein
MKNEIKNYEIVIIFLQKQKICAVFIAFSFDFFVVCLVSVSQVDWASVK